MDVTKRLDTLVAPLRDDVESGSVEMARRAADLLGRAASTVHAGNVVELRSTLGYLGVRIVEAQPAMASLVALVAETLAALEDHEDPEEARKAARDAARAFASRLDERGSALASRAAARLPEGAVLTLSASSTVLRTLQRAVEVGRTPRVVVLESRPVREGRDTARALARTGVDVVFAVDAAVGALVGECSAVLLGADSVGDRGVVNKVGSLPATLAAQVAGVPVIVAADSSKLLPPGYPQALADDRPVDQVWHPPGGVRVWNRYFEAVPTELIATLVTEAGAYGPAEVEALRRALPFPEALRKWAGEVRGTDPSPK